MFWTDAHEEPSAPGTVYLFGKALDREVCERRLLHPRSDWSAFPHLLTRFPGPFPESQSNTYQSCCVVVPNLERELHFLPRLRANPRTQERERVPMLEVYEEVSQIMGKLIPPDKGAFGSRPVKLKYAFEVPDVPRGETEYLQVRGCDGGGGGGGRRGRGRRRPCCPSTRAPTSRPGSPSSLAPPAPLDQVVYPPKFPSLDPETSGRTFSHVFGTTTRCLETFLLDRDLMGPGWLRLRNVKNRCAVPGRSRAGAHHAATQPRAPTRPRPRARAHARTSPAIRARSTSPLPVLARSSPVSFCSFEVEVTGSTDVEKVDGDRPNPPVRARRGRALVREPLRVAAARRFRYRDCLPARAPARSPCRIGVAAPRSSWWRRCR